jgi:predicted RNA-binding protein with PIN domain/Skp family chaperone for outer membrane proteins
LTTEEVPGPLRAVARFTPRRRAKATMPIATALSTDEKFRAVVGGYERQQQPDLVAALEAGEPPAAGDPVELAAVSWLLRSPHWESLVEAAATAGAAASAAAATAAETTTRLREQLDATRATGRAELSRMRAELAGVRSELERVRAEVRRERDRASRAKETAQSAAAATTAAEDRAAQAARAAEAELRRLRTRAADAERAVEAARREGRDHRATSETRMRLLLDTIVGAGQGLARELALPPAATLPADSVEGASAPTGGAHVAWAGATDAPEFLAELLAVPGVHLVVDGYNVTKTGYGELPLEQQRSRLVGGLGGLAARTRAEITCVFDGAGFGSVPAASGGRRVRVLFSDPGVTADEVIRRVVAAEPPGRPIVVVSADREVAEGVARPGVTALPSLVLLRLLDSRGDAGR